MSVNPSAQQMLLFEAGGLPLGIFVAEVTRLLLEEQELTPVPFAHPAMAGLIDGGALGALPVFDLAGLFSGQAPLRSLPGATIAVFTTERGPVGLRMERRTTTPSYRYLDDPAAEAERLDKLPEIARRVLMGVGESEAGPFYFFSPEAFVLALDLGRAGRPEQHDPAHDPGRGPRDI